MFVFQENLNSVIVCEEEKPIQEVLSLLILLAERVINAAQEAESYKSGNLAIARLVTELSKLLRPLARLTATSATLYDRPIRRVCLDLAKALDRASTFARRCRHERTNFLHQVLSINTAADYKKASALLDSSLGDLRWLLSIYNRDCYDHGTMPPLACTDPILAYVWPAIAALHMGQGEGAQQLADFANNERTKNVIVEEIGIPPLLKMLSEGRNADAQSAAATALCYLGDDQYRMKVIRDEHGVEAVVAAMAKGPPMRVQLVLVDLVLKMLEMDVASVQEEFGAENVTRLLVALLGVDVDLDEFLELNYPKTSRSSSSSSHLSADISTSGEMKMKVSGECSRSEKEREREREAEPPEVKSRLKISCAVALWKLARRSLLNSRNITETKALLVLAKIIKKEHGELKENCLKVVMELAAVAESHADLKRSAFKLTSTPAKVVLDQLLKVMDEEKRPQLVVPAVKAVGCLASMFLAKERHVVRSLVAQLSHWDHDVAAEAARALSKFVCGQNYNRKEHSEAIIEFDGVPKLMILLRKNVRGCFHLDELVLLCNLAVNGHNTRPLEEVSVLSVLESAAKHVVSERPDLRELFAKAIHQLVIYQVGVHPHLHSSEV
ncbi:hypothetical protein C2S53_011355 [Perilla frutescens var. hirtella]|uniref:DUF7792 domain-containing protein n=1 Tax=Perilla frutescens var. hirtella TaxID=608512 RepID=A0AAD4J8Q6_PERFH|nr:hypothetical protein C2S53_011355 [Perilla frutescens var. hirtella]